MASVTFAHDDSNRTFNIDKVLRMHANCGSIVIIRLKSDFSSINPQVEVSINVTRNTNQAKLDP